MSRKMLMFAAGAAALSPAMLLANPGGVPAGGPHAGATMSSPMSSPGPMSQSPTAPSSTPMGSTNGAGYNHTNGPTHATGQPGAECGSASAPTTPGHAATAPGSAFNEDGRAGTRYAGEQPQNSRNTASVSQYDSACLSHPR